MQDQLTCNKFKIAFTIIISMLLFSQAGFAKNEIEFIPGEDSGFFYIIEKGDTLWDLAHKFYNSEWDWPALWEMNDDIKNPHWIYPGKKIRIFFKEKGKLKPIIVTVKKSNKPPEKLKPSFSFAQMDHIAFVRKTAQAGLGKIIKEKEGNLAISINDTVFIKPANPGALVPGKVYHVYSTSDIEERLEETEVFTGVKHLIKATVKITADRGEYVIGLVGKNYYEVAVGDMLMEYYDHDEVLTVEENNAPLDVRVVGSQNDNLVTNDYQIGFINAGRDTVKPGQIYTVKRRNTIKDPSLWTYNKKEKPIDLENLESGKIIILHTEDIAATVMIISSKYAISTNDIVN